MLKTLQNMGCKMELRQFLNKFSDMETSGDKFKVKCPAHDDKTASLVIWEDDRGYIALNCFDGCITDSILGKLNLEKKDLVTEKALTQYKKNLPSRKNKGNY